MRNLEQLQLALEPTPAMIAGEQRVRSASGAESTEGRGSPCSSER